MTSGANTRNPVCIAKTKAVITCSNKTYNGSTQSIATCSGGTVANASQINAGNYTITCTGDSTHLNADSKTCSIAKKKCPFDVYFSGNNIDWKNHGLIRLNTLAYFDVLFDKNNCTITSAKCTDYEQNTYVPSPDSYRGDVITSADPQKSIVYVQSAPSSVVNEMTCVMARAVPLNNNYTESIGLHMFSWIP